MAYGDTMAYTYEAEIEKENGETEVKQETLHFTYNANTALIYKRLFDSDFLHDVTKLTSGAIENVSSETLEKINKGDISVGEISDMDINDKKLAEQAESINLDSALLTQIAISMIATNDSVNRQPRRTVEEIANDLPDVSTNIELMLALIEFITSGLKKKKIVSRRF